MSTLQTVPTFEQMMQMFNETYESIKETRESIRETRESIKETRESIRESAAETDRAIRISHAITEKSIDSIAAQHAITEKSIDSLVAQHAITEKSIDSLVAQQEETAKALQDYIVKGRKERKKLSKSVGDLSNRFGEIAEHMVFPSIVARFNELNYTFHKEFSGNFKIRDASGKTLTEIDALLENGNTIAVVEVKTKPQEKHIPKHLDRIAIFKQYRIDMNEPPKTIIGAIAGAIFPKEVKDAALDAGFYVLVQSGDTMKFDIPENFVPTKF